MTKRRIVRVGLLTVALVLVAGAAAGWWVFLRDDTPAKATLVDRKVVKTTDELDGSWTVQPGENVFAGYRITEKFGAIDNTAVARTGAVEARITVAGTEVTEVTATVNMASLKSQDNQLPGVGNRDGAMKTKGLETDTFPTATFSTTKPIELHKLPKPGAEMAFTAVGKLELHGVSRTVTVPMAARWNGEVIDLTGSLEVRLADYDIEQPAANVVTVADTGTMELQLTFARQT